MSSKILITGGTGYLGRSLTKKYLECTDDPILLLIRAKNQTDFQNKTENLNREFGFPKHRVTYVDFDLSEEKPLGEIDAKTIKLIIHTAAITRFDVNQEDAARVNVRGTTKLMQFADTCPSLEQIGLLSTIYSSGLRAGSIEEKPLSNELGFANHYEWSKWELERSALEAFAHLPFSIFRSATIIADDDNGQVTQYNVFHNTIRLIYQGLLTLLPGKSETPIYLVTGEFVTNAIFNILGLAAHENQRIFNLAHIQDRSVTLGEIVEIAFEVFSKDEQFSKKRISKPRYIDLDTFNIVINQIDSFGSGSMRLAISSMQPFVRQLFIAKDIKNGQMAASINPYSDPMEREIITRTCQFLLKTNWGKSFSAVN